MAAGSRDPALCVRSSRGRRSGPSAAGSGGAAVPPRTDSSLLLAAEDPLETCRIIFSNLLQKVLTTVQLALHGWTRRTETSCV